jgi:hypothetical protein
MCSSQWLCLPQSKYKTCPGISVEAQHSPPANLAGVFVPGWCFLREQCHGTLCSNLRQALHASCTSAMVVVTPVCGPLAAIGCAPIWPSVSWSQVTPGAWTLPALILDSASDSLYPGTMIGWCADACNKHFLTVSPVLEVLPQLYPHRVPCPIYQSWLFHCGNHTVNLLYIVQLSVAIYIWKSSSFTIHHTTCNSAHWALCP